MNQILKKKILNFLKIIISIILISYIISQLNLDSLSAKFTNIWFILFFIFLLFINIFNNVIISALKLKNILQSFSKEKIKFWEVAKIYLYSTFFGLFLPTNFGGDGAKCIFLERKYKNIGRSSVILSVFLERISGILALLGIMAVSLIVPSVRHYYWLIFDLIANRLSINQSKTIIIILLFCVLFSVIIYLTVRYRSKVIGLIESFKKINYFTVFLLSFIFQFLMILNNIIAYYYFSGQTNYTAFVIIIPITILLMTLPISFQGIGLRDGLALLLFPLFFVNPKQEDIISYTLSMNLLIVFSSLLGGVLYLIKKIKPTS
ncbi:MAG: lysylphosphatidylglycerol synthase domain-containing protein [Patescibacteria group bacterium]